VPGRRERRSRGDGGGRGGDDRGGPGRAAADRLPGEEADGGECDRAGGGRKENHGYGEAQLPVLEDPEPCRRSECRGTLEPSAPARSEEVERPRPESAGRREQR